MKLKYETPKIDIVQFTSKDVITASGTGGWEAEDDPIDSPGGKF